MRTAADLIANLATDRIPYTATHAQVFKLASGDVILADSRVVSEVARASRVAA